MIRKLQLIFCILLFVQPVYALDVTWGTDTQISDGRQGDSVVIGTDKLVACLTRFDLGRCRVMTISGTTPTQGTLTTFESDADCGIASCQTMGVAKADTDQFAVFYTVDGNDDGDVIAANVSGTEPTFGTATNHDPNHVEEGWDAAGISTDKVVYTYNDETNSDTCETVVCTNDATPDMTCGAELECDGDGTTDYHPAKISTIRLATDKWVACWRAIDDSDDGYCVVGTASGTTITYSVDPNEFADASTLDTTGVCSPSDVGGTDDRFVVVYSDSGDTEIIAATVSGGTITYGTALTGVDSGTTHGHSCTFVSETQVVIGYADSTNLDGSTVLLTVDWATRAVTSDDLGEEDFFGGDVGNSTNSGVLELGTLSGFNTTTPKIHVVYFQDVGDIYMVLVGDLSITVGGEAYTHLMMVD